MLIPHKNDGRQHSILEQLFDKQHRRARSVVKNAFGMMKEGWRELLAKTDMHVSIVLNMFVWCYILYNLIIKKDCEVNVDELVRRMQVNFKEDLWLQEHGVNGRTYKGQQEYAHRLEEGEVSSEEQRRLVENYFKAQP